MEAKDLRTGDIINCYLPFTIRKPRRIISSLIRLVSMQQYSHTAVVVKISGETFVVDSDVGKGVRLMVWDDWVDWCFKANITINRRRVVDYDAFCKRVLPKVGKAKYDVLGTLFYQTIYRITGKWKGYTNERKAAKRFYCSEFVGWAHEIPEWYKLSPGDIMERITDSEIVYHGDCHKLV